MSDVLAARKQAQKCKDKGWSQFTLAINMVI